MDTFYAIFHFAIAIGILVSFHEFGHFWVARKVGVKVIRFSVGFGKVIWSYQRTPDSTEYVLSAIPLGGYVNMLDERKEQVAAADLPYSFNQQSLLARTAIVVAGPLFNLLLAIILFWSILMLGESGQRPIVGEIEAGTLLAQAGFVEGEEIIAINNKPTRIWTEAIDLLLSAVLQGKQEIPITVKNSDAIEQTRYLKIEQKITQQPELLFKQLGLNPWSPPLEPIIGEVLDAGRAKEAGLRAGDVIISADNEPIVDWAHWVDYVKSRPEIAIQLLVARDEAQLAYVLVPQRIKDETGEYGRIGAQVKIPQDLIDFLTVEYSLSPYAALLAAVEKTWFYAANSLQMMGKIVIGEASTNNLSGPIGIAQHAGKSAAMGLVAFLKFLAVVSISLGILNLLPIPMLDGGHLLFFAIEAIKGSPVSEQLQIVVQNIGLLFLLLLMTFVIFLDVERVFQ